MHIYIWATLKRLALNLYESFLVTWVRKKLVLSTKKKSTRISRKWASYTQPKHVQLRQLHNPTTFRILWLLALISFLSILVISKIRALSDELSGTETQRSISSWTYYLIVWMHCNVRYAAEKKINTVFFWQRESMNKG